MSKIYLSSKGIKPTIDNSTIINNTISKAKDGDILIFPQGDFPIHKTIIQENKAINLEGNNTNINIALNVPALIVRGTTLSNISGFTFDNWYGLEDGNTDGVIISSVVKMQNCWIKNFGGNGITVSADVTTNGYNASFSKFVDLLISNNKGHGIYFQGGDANQCKAYDMDVRDNGGVGIYDHSFLGNQFFGCMAHYNAKGNYRADDPNNRAGFYGCYSEQGSPPEYLAGAATWHGGLAANGFELHSWAKVFINEENARD